MTKHLRAALLGERVPFLLAVLAIWTALRLFTTGVLVWIATSEQDSSIYSGDVPRYFEVATLWDGQWYERIATAGYPDSLPLDDSGQVRQNEWAFYPVFPFLARAVMLTGAPFSVAAVIVATLLGYAAALVIAGLVKDVVGPVAALGTVALVGAFPASPTMQVAYTESLAMLLLASALWLLAKRRWGAAALVALLTGLARPIALPLGLVALVAVIVRWRRRDDNPIDRREWASMASALVACGASGLMWPAIAWWGTRQSDAYTVTMSAWRQGEPISPFTPTIEIVHFLFGPTAGPVYLAIVLIALVVAVLGPWARGLGPVMRTWCLGYPLYLFAALDPWTSIYRYLLPLFPLAIVLLGLGWERSDPRGRVPGWLTAIRVAVFVGLFLAWQVWWTWELFMFVPPQDNPP